MNIDNQLTNAIYTLPHSAHLDSIFHFFSATGIFELWWIIICISVMIIQEIKHPRFMFSFFISVISSAILTNIILKNLFMRARPLSDHPPLHYLTDYSFPSGHATFAFAAACILAHYDEKRTHFYYIVAACVAFSRVYLGFHYVSDVIAGAVIGYVVSCVTLHIIDNKYA